MGQLALKFSQNLPYGADNFLVHNGVRETLLLAAGIAAGRQFAVSWIYGSARTGKTHLSVRLADSLLAAGLFPNLIEGHDITQFLSDRGSKGPFSPDEVFIFDGAHNYFTETASKNSAEFVAFIELAKMTGNPVVILSEIQYSLLNCDNHIMSRLRAGHLLPILPPCDLDMHELVSLMARQRGIMLTERRIKYLARRLRRDIPSIEEYLNRVNQISLKSKRPVKIPLLSEALLSETRTSETGGF